MAFYTAVIYFERWQDDLRFRELGSPYDYAEFSPTARARRPIASNSKRVKNGEI